MSEPKEETQKDMRALLIYEEQTSALAGMIERELRRRICLTGWKFDGRSGLDATTFEVIFVPHDANKTLQQLLLTLRGSPALKVGYGGVTPREHTYDAFLNTVRMVDEPRYVQEILESLLH